MTRKRHLSLDRPNGPSSTDSGQGAIPPQEDGEPSADYSVRLGRHYAQVEAEIDGNVSETIQVHVRRAQVHLENGSRDEEETRRLGRFGRAFVRSLRENRPNAYQALAESGELQAVALDVDERATEQFETLMRHFQQSEGLPPSHFDRAAALDGIRQRAEALVYDEILVRDAETEAVEDTGYE